jgi:hypothetical protein
VTEPLEFTLIARLRQVLADQPAGEGELRELGEQAEGWGRALQGQIYASERRLGSLDADPASPLAEIAGELRHVDALRAEMVELSSLKDELDRRARELRAEWLTRQVGRSQL